MVAGLELNALINFGLMAILLVVLGVGISSLRYRRRIGRLTANYERQVQLLQQAITDRGQEVKAQQRALTEAGHRLAERDQRLQAQEQHLQDAAEAQQRVEAIQNKVAELTTQVEMLHTELAVTVTQRQALQHETEQLQQAFAKKDHVIAQLEEERKAYQAQITQLEDKVTDHGTALAKTQAAHEHEVTLRRHFTAEIHAIYQRLQGSDESFTPEQKLSTSIASKNEVMVAHDAMDSTPNGTHAADTTVSIISNPQEFTPTPQSNGIASQNAEPNSASAARLVDFLAGRGITVTHIPSEESFDPVLNGLANFLGTHYEVVKPLYQQIKRNMQLGDDFAINLKDESPRNISLICQFGKKLYDVAFLEQYRYFRSPQYLLRAKTTRLPTAQNFFSGQWLERYIMQQVGVAVNTVRAQSTESVDFGYVANPHITLANEQEGELDFLFYVNEAIYWIETKSGDYQQHISKYSMIARTLDLDEHHAIMVLTDIPPSRSAELTALFGMGVCSLEQFQEELLRSLQQDLEMARSSS